jgi:hypothetical protein
MLTQFLLFIIILFYKNNKNIENATNNGISIFGCLYLWSVCSFVMYFRDKNEVEYVTKEQRIVDVLWQSVYICVDMCQCDISEQVRKKEREWAKVYKRGRSNAFSRREK